MTSEFELGWIVAILEGEGCFTISGGTPKLYLGMTDYDSVLYASQIISIGASKIYARKRGRHKTLYEFNVYGRDAIKWMRLVRPYMKARRSAEIDWVINTILSSRPYFELGLDFCPRKGHSIKHSWEYYLSPTDGSKTCRRCSGMKIIYPMPTINDPNHKFINPFIKKEISV